MAHYFDGPLHSTQIYDPQQASQSYRNKLSRSGADGLAIPETKSGIKTRNLQYQHYRALNTILQRCILEQDYVRASRALGTLLRMELMGQECNIRKHSLWIVAAEILLRRDHPTNTELAGHAGLHESPSSNSETTNQPTLSLQGFKMARDFMDRLIVQYPEKKRDPDQKYLHCTALEFYPIMLSLWILQIQTETKRNLKAVRTAAATVSHLQQTISDSLSNGATESNHGLTSVREVTNNQLRQARDVKQALDDVISRPLYDRNTMLLQLRSDVDSWIGDLTKQAK